MESLRRLLPSASNLIVFEAAGRHGSFTRAAAELAMTQAAVSYAVRSLETQLGTPLFRRAHRAVELTEAGRRFHADVTLGLGHIRKSAEEIRARGRDVSVTLAASTAFASMWMLPRLQRLRDELPDIDLRIQTSDRDLELDNEPIQLGIRGGRPEHWPGYESALLAPEIIEAVASPLYLDRFGAPESVAHLTRHRLIHLEEPYRTACDWRQWFLSAGVNGATANRVLAINDYVLVIQAVLEGQGVALGWQHLTERLVASGLLRPVTEHRLDTGAAFYVIWPKSRVLSKPARDVRDWLMAEGRSASPGARSNGTDQPRKA
ncbi:DNA-binding transcriptional LysR family regulator [Hoeflea marina]|uniref:DNA-binding transcriptional LysR family regulator n=1 Tax=Hoeflea marina TaxID=274592 RepID=A0A317PLK0_9HYPH|nr:LysR substrate-binding domain-containing protein [Hoeflea marina]PWW01627.1 DNA-binding transcriptional LysR family regulator [Hoeflea marina]